MEVVTGFIMDRIMKQLEELMLACKGGGRAFFKC
jgi:hypothetical protein